LLDRVVPIYQAPIGYVTQPKKDKRGDFFVAAQVCAAGLGISSVLISYQSLREYFYRIPRIQDQSDRRTLYDVLTFLQQRPQRS
jgi:hypothetical protein